MLATGFALSLSLSFYLSMCVYLSPAYKFISVNWNIFGWLCANPIKLLADNRKLVFYCGKYTAFNWMTLFLNWLTKYVYVKCFEFSDQINFKRIFIQLNVISIYDYSRQIWRKINAGKKTDNGNHFEISEFHLKQRK